MDIDRKKALQKQLEFYSGLLKKHETAKKTHELVSSSVSRLPKNSNWKQPSSSAYKMVINPTSKSTSFTRYPLNKFHRSVANSTKTAAFNEVNNFKARHKFISNKAVKSINIPSNTIRTTSDKYPFAQCKKPNLVSENTGKATKIEPDMSQKETEYLSLIKEIEVLTERLKKTSENKSKVVNTTAVRDDISVQTNPLNCKSSSKNFKYCTFSKCNVFESKKQFNSTCNAMNSSVALRGKLNGFNKTNLISDSKRKHISSLSLPNSVNKYSFKKVDTGKMLNSETSCTHSKTVVNEKKSEKNVQKSISDPQLQNLICQDFKSVADNLSCDNAKIDTKPLNQDSTPNLKLGVTLKPVLSDAKSKCHPNIILKPQNVQKSYGVSNASYADSKYKRVNSIQSVVSNKNLRFRHASSHLRSSAAKKMKKKVNTTFKLINKTVTPQPVRKGILEKSSLGSKENSLLTGDKSDPLFKFLNDSSIDKLEQDLLALSTTLTATPISIKNDDKVLQNKFKKMNPKLSQKKMSLKNSKTRLSKYKVVNSVASHSYVLKNRPSFTSLKSSKKIKSKFSLINKHVHGTPVIQGKSILIKRLFKSKNAIINKNVSSTNHSAKMIKYKYFALNKRNQPYEKSVLYPKVPFLQPKFKGYLSPKLYSKKNRYQKSPILACSQRTVRRFSRYSCNTRNSLLNKSIVGKNCKKKLHNGYGRPPVVFIRGLKYSLNSSGKTLRKLPVQGFTKIHHKVIINDKRYARTSENKVKACTPVSANLASRVLHRSITQVLSASSKKKLTKVNSYCMFYNRFGRCNRGAKCTYIHDPSKIAVCTRFLRGTCKIDGCPFSHEIAPGKMAICSFYLVGACDKNDCPYRHENLSPEAELCKAFVQGYCPSGKECKKAHILICPKYIQGNCEKGTSCAFPHPPQKEPKNVQKEIDGEENKQGDALLEKVARYFQPNKDISLPLENKSNGNNTANLFVPKQRKLEEQPSFIPLCDSPVILTKGYKNS